MAVPATIPGSADSVNAFATAQISVSAITVLPGRRRLDPAWVETLSDLFSSQGQLSPIEVIADDDRFRLVFGQAPRFPIFSLDGSVL